MCMYSSDNGHAKDFHLVHLGGFALRGVGAICVEATSVLPEGRISPEDAVSVNAVAQHPALTGLTTTAGVVDRHPDRAAQADRRVF